MKVRALQGQRFGRLVVIEREPKHRRVVWLCRCDCGTLTVIQANHLCSGATKSCGCDRAAQNVKHGHGRQDKQSRTYRSWARMIQRCTNPAHDKYAWYGGAGVKVCPEWRRSFEEFLADMGERPARTTLGRFLDTGDYEPGNVAWMTTVQQGLEKRNRNALAKWGGRLRS